LISNDLDFVQRVLEDVRVLARRELAPRGEITTRVKCDGSILTEYDQRMQDGLSTWVKTYFPAAALLGEEMEATHQHHLLQESDLLWCVDPLDGTSNFAAGVPFYAVSGALLEHGRIVFGFVYDPVRDEMFYGLSGQGAYLNNQPLMVRSTPIALKHSVANVDFKRLPKSLALALIEQCPYRSQRSFGSVALDWCWLAAGRGDIYLHGKQKLWDYAAGSLILSEVGGYAGTLDGKSLLARDLDRVDLEPKSACAALNKQTFTEWLAYC